MQEERKVGEIKEGKFALPVSLPSLLAN
jgi:hypothetical protein